MKTILPPVSAIQKICGVQEPRDTQYRLTRHCVTAACAHGQLYYHTLTGELLLLEAGDTPEWPSLRDELVGHWFLVPTDFDENEFTGQVRRVAELLTPRRDGIRDYTVFTTTDCNARCYYCYEAGHKRSFMTDKTAHDAAAFMAERSGGQSLRISWFGGEPLYNKRVIDIICDDLSLRGCTFTSSMTSNGYYLDEETARRARERWKLTTVQITLDGTRDTYNRTKAYRNAENDPFERVLHNIDHALDAGIRVQCRLNMDRSNAGDLPELCDLLGERFRERPGFGAFVIPLQTFAGQIHEFENDREALDCFHKIENRLRELGIARKREPLDRILRLDRCMADNDGSLCITPDGSLSKCEHHSDTELIGSIYSDWRDAERIEAWKEQVVFPECAPCPLFPRCVNLKKCQWTEVGCTGMTRTIRLERLKDQILKEYAKEREKI